MHDKSKYIDCDQDRKRTSNSLREFLFSILVKDRRNSIDATVSTLYRYGRLLTVLIYVLNYELISNKRDFVYRKSIYKHYLIVKDTIESTIKKVDFLDFLDFSRFNSQ